MPGLQHNNFYICSFCCVIVLNTLCKMFSFLHKYLRFFYTSTFQSEYVSIFLIPTPYFLRLGLSAVGWTVTVFSITCGLYVVIDLFCMVEALLRAPRVVLVRALVRATWGLFAMSGGDGKGEEERGYTREGEGGGMEWRDRRGMRILNRRQLLGLY